MSDVSKFIRQTRFDIKEASNVRLTIETSTGSRFNLKVINCSISGLGAILSEHANFQNEGIDNTAIIPNAKLVIDDEEITLGRLAVRRILFTENNAHIAFSTIDCRVPIDRSLSKYIEAAADSGKNAYEFELSPEKFSLATFVDSNHTNIDLFHRAEQFAVFFKDWKNTKKFQYRNIRTASKGQRINLRQQRKGRRNDYLVMASNDYLGLASHPEVIEAAKKAIDDYGFGSTGSAVSTGLTDIHEELTSYVAKLFRKEAAILFNSGYGANVGSIPALTTAQDLIVADVLSHASIQDGMQMSKATSRFFKHNDIQHLEAVLKEHRDSHVGALVITEGVFSMDGDKARLEEVLHLAKKYNARTFLDEAHSFGVIGQTGLGLWETCPNQSVDVIMGTFSKICGGIGGFIAASNEVVDWMNFYGRSHVFSVSIPPSTAAAALKALQIFSSQPELLINLKKNITHFVRGLRDLGCPISAEHDSAVIPVVVGDEDKLGKMNEVFREEGVYVIPVIYPAVGKKNCRFRFTVMATHSTSDLDYVLNVIEKAMLKAGFEFSQQSSELKKVA